MYHAIVITNSKKTARNYENKNMKSLGTHAQQNKVIIQKNKNHNIKMKSKKAHLNFAIDVLVY